MGPKRLLLTLLGNIMCPTVAINLTKKLLGPKKLPKLKIFAKKIYYINYC